MVNYIGEVSILCMKIAYMLLCTTNIGNAYKCCLYAGTWHIKSLHTLLYMLHMGITISAIYMQCPYLLYTITYNQS